MQSTRPCSFPECERPLRTRGYCTGHYKQLMDGRPLDRLQPRGLPLEQRLDQATDTSGECWIWTGTLNTKGYGTIEFRNRTLYAHCLSFERVNGPVPDGMMVDHKCHNPGCVRPDHLQSVTRKQNGENRSGATRASRSGVRGVHWYPTYGKWAAKVGHNGRNHHAGYFDSIEDAEAAVIAKRNELFTNNLADRA